MAKIIFSAQSNIVWDPNNALSIDAFYEGFLDELKKLGHQVLFIRTNGLCKTKSKSNRTPLIKAQIILNKLRSFSPDLIITANHAIPKVILENTTCPVVILNSDSVDYYNDKDYIKKNIDRYYFFHFDKSLSYVDPICRILGAKPEQNYFLGNATAVRNRQESIRNNIIFLGTFGWPGKIQFEISCMQKQKELNELIKKFDDSMQSKINFNQDFLHVATINKRIKILDALVDLGLKIHCYSKQLSLLVPYSMDLLRACDLTPVYSIKDIEKTYNSSLIAPTLPNAQAIEGFSWRVTEVMASNACLISHPSKDLMDLFPFIPIYNSPAEARDLCKKLLHNKSWRDDIVAQSNEIIEKNFRFKNMFKRIESSLGIDLTSKHPENTGCIDNSLNIKFAKKVVKDIIIINHKGKRFKILREVCKILPYFLASKILRILNK